MPTNFAIHFKRQNADHGTERVVLDEGRPDWLHEAVREAHQGTLPADWIYEECRAAVEAFDDETLAGEDDDVHEHADSRVDVYTKELFRWAADFCLTDTWANAEQEAADMGWPDETVKRVAVVQYAAIRQIAFTMLEACRRAVAEAA